MEEREVVVLSAVRTAVGKFGGALKDQAPTALAAGVLREAVIAAGLVVPAMFVLGAIFAALWVIAIWLGNRYREAS